MHLCDGTYFKMTTFQVKTVTNIRFSNRKEDEWIKSADVTFSIVVFTNALTIPNLSVFFIFAVEGLTAKTAKRRSPRKKTVLQQTSFSADLKICNQTGLKKNRNRSGFTVTMTLICFNLLGAVQIHYYTFYGLFRPTPLTLTQSYNPPPPSQCKIIHRYSFFSR